MRKIVNNKKELPELSIRFDYLDIGDIFRFNGSTKKYIKHNVDAYRCKNENIKHRISNIKEKVILI